MLIKLQGRSLLSKIWNVILLLNVFTLNGLTSLCLDLNYHNNTGLVDKVSQENVFCFWAFVFRKRRRGCDCLYHHFCAVQSRRESCVWEDLCSPKLRCYSSSTPELQTTSLTDWWIRTRCRERGPDRRRSNVLHNHWCKTFQEIKKPTDDCVATCSLI